MTVWISVLVFIKVKFSSNFGVFNASFLCEIKRVDIFYDQRNKVCLNGFQLQYWWEYLKAIKENPFFQIYCNLPYEKIGIKRLQSPHYLKYGCKNLEARKD